jgi:hypothetical protein
MVYIYMVYIWCIYGIYGTTPCDFTPILFLRPALRQLGDGAEDHLRGHLSAG